MSLLWPEAISVGLFPGQCWLQRGRADNAPSQAHGAAADAGALLRALETMLADQGELLRKGSKVALQVSDSMGVITALPWQDELSAPQEIYGYGQACFEQQGIVIDERWVMRTEFRQHRAMGIAYALPRAWMEELLTLLSARGLRLERVLPVSAMAYSVRPRLVKSSRGLVVLHEARRTTALVYEHLGLCGIDVEPITSCAEAAGTRLLRRIGACHGAIDTVWKWAPELPASTAPTDYIAHCLPDAVVHVARRGAWS